MSDETSANLAAKENKMAEETKDCCEIWPKLLPAFDWMSAPIDGRVMVMMPHFQPYPQSEKWRVNYCPSCGAERRDVMISQETLADLLF